MADVTFPISNTHVNTGVNTLAFRDVTAQVAGHTSYAIGLDVSNWTTAEVLTIGLTFRIDNTILYEGAFGTLRGGTYIDPWTQQPFLPNVGGPIPAFGTKLEVAAKITVPSGGNVNGTITLR